MATSLEKTYKNGRLYTNQERASLLNYNRLDNFMMDVIEPPYQCGQNTVNKLTAKKFANLPITIREYINNNATLNHNIPLLYSTTNSRLSNYSDIGSLSLSCLLTPTILASDLLSGNTSTESDFLTQNIDIVLALPQLTSYIKSNLGENTRLKLELLNERESWQTLFINIYAAISWAEWDKFRDLFFDYLFDTFPLFADKVNIGIIPDEF